jgi:nucleoside phosphorylase/regulator of replication initiation timing
MPDSKLRQKYQNLPCVVIITAISEEYKAVRAHFTDVEEETHPNGTVYKWGIFSTNNRTWGVAIAQIGAGNANAAAETTRAIDFFQPRVLLFVGIAGGIKDVKLGHVVAATKIYGYESGKVEEEGFRPRPDAPRVSYRLEQRATSEANEEEWLQKIQGRIPKRTPRAWVGAIVAGDKVLASKDSEIYNLLRSNYGDALAVEMEGHGFLQAVRANQEVNALVIRGISDLIEGKNRKGENTRQITAARHASAFAFQILSKLDLGQIETQKVKQLEEELGRLRAKYSAMENEIERLRTENSAMKMEKIAAMEQEIKEIENQIASLEQELEDAIPPQARKAMDWLANRKELAQKAVDNVLNNFTDLRNIIDNTDSPQNTLKRFCRDIEDYLELLYYSFYPDGGDLLQEPDIPLSLPVEAYVEALRYIKQRVPENIGSEVPEVKGKLEYLIKKLLF